MNAALSTSIVSSRSTSDARMWPRPRRCAPSSPGPTLKGTSRGLNYRQSNAAGYRGTERRSCRGWRWFRGRCELTRGSHTPLHFQPIAHWGACGKTRVVAHNRWSGPKVSDAAPLQAAGQDAFRAADAACARMELVT
jgi:hypothetical protein